jgi:undecaprenyl diphosphate synthase
MSSAALQALKQAGEVPGHIAIIMDGNGRWARQRGLPRSMGHREGMKAVREAIEGSIEAGVGVLTLFAFSTENWNRPWTEISALMALLQHYADRERKELQARGVRVTVLGDLDRMDAPSRRAIDEIVNATQGGDRLRLNLMISYSGRDEILRAARLVAEAVERGELRPADVDEAAFRERLFTHGCSDPDLLIRSSGEFRISNFMLWQLAYTEIHITPVLWPDFSREDLFRAVLDYQSRDRRFGRVPTP